jgi:hypothetical protein
MVERRTLLSGGMAAGASAMLAAEPAAAAGQSQDGDGGVRVARAIDDLRGSLDQQAAPAPALVRIRNQKHLFLRANRKFPDFIEVGIDAWEAIHDWQVARQHAPAMHQLTDSRYVMTVMFTTLILRPDQRADLIGFPFDTPQV